MSSNNLSTSFSFSAPGSIMISGEHAVVYGHQALVAAIDQRIRVQISTRTDRNIHIRSQIAPPGTFSLDDFSKEGAYRFVLACVDLYKSTLTQGFDISIESNIDPTLGLGSSAAVTIAALACIRKSAGQSTDQSALVEMHSEALAVVRSIQGRGSGADLAASLFGGLIAYRAEGKEGASEVEPLPLPPLLYLAYCGYKTPTADVLEKIANDMQGKETLYQNLYRAMGTCTAKTIDAARDKNWQAAAVLLNDYQKLMFELGVSDQTLDALIEQAQSTTGCIAAKISGSGLGDCVLAMASEHHTLNIEGFRSAPIAQKGLEHQDD